MTKQDKLEAALSEKARAKAASLGEKVSRGNLTKEEAKKLYDSYRDGQYDAVEIMHGRGLSKPIVGSDDEIYPLIGLVHDEFDSSWK